MGLYDRDYGRPDQSSWQPGLHLGGTRSLTTNLVLITIGIYLIQVLTYPSPQQRQFLGDDGWFTNLFSLYGDTLTKPWLCFQFLTYGFLHAPNHLPHILFNMFGFWMFGRTVEMKYGRREYLYFYLVAIIFAGATWYLAELASNRGQLPLQMLGASGGLSAVLILFALNFPRQLVYIWGVFPIPAWIFALLFVGSDLYGAVNRTSHVAFTAHLGGALFAYLYFRNRWKLSNWLPQGGSLPSFRSGPKLRIHDPEVQESKTDDQVDRILRKIQAEGQESLTWKERRILEKASKQYRDKNR